MGSTAHASVDGIDIVESFADNNQPKSKEVHSG